MKFDDLYRTLQKKSQMNITLIIANVLVLLTFLVHTFAGDRAYKRIEPAENNPSIQEKWTMGRGAFHIVSADFLLASIGLTLLNFTEYFTDNLFFHIRTCIFIYTYNF
jgi:hypothetical protein